MIPQSTPVGPALSQKNESSFDYRTRDYVSPPNLTQAFISQLKASPHTPK